MKRLILAIGVTAALTTTLASCGSKTETTAPAASTTTAAPKLTKAQIVEKADAICKDFDTKQKALPEPKTEADLGTYLESGLKLAKEQLAAIKALGEPADDAAAWNAAIETQSKTIDALDKKLPEFKKDPASISKDTEMQELSDAADKAAKDIGLKECGKSSSSSSK